MLFSVQIIHGIFFCRYLCWYENFFNLILYIHFDRAERNDFWSRFLVILLLLFFPLFLGGKRKGERINKVVIKSHAFLLDHTFFIEKMRILAFLFCLTSFVNATNYVAYNKVKKLCFGVNQIATNFFVI